MDDFLRIQRDAHQMMQETKVEAAGQGTGPKLAIFVLEGEEPAGAQSRGDAQGTDAPGVLLDKDGRAYEDPGA